MKPTVFLVDDDAAVRDGLSQLLAAHGLAVRTFASAEDFLAACNPHHAGCIVLDMRLPGMSGIDLQAALAARGIDLPIIFLTGYGDVPTSVQAIKNGAVDFLEKPASAQALLERVRAAFALDGERRAAQAARARAEERISALTGRERQVMVLTAAGRANKEIARLLGISHRTVELHRARVMHKTGAATLIDLADLARAAGMTADCPAPAAAPTPGKPR